MIMRIEVCYGLPDRQEVVELAAQPGWTILDAIRASGFIDRFAIDLGSQRVGVFGKLGRLDQLLEEGDRVEIYRPLVVDAQAARRRRAARKK